MRELEGNHLFANSNSKQQPFDATVDDAQTSQTEIEDTNIAAVGRDLVVTEDDLLEARDTAASYSLEDVRRVSYPLLFI